MEAVEAMRSHLVYTAFERRWQLPVYFQLRWKDIVGKLEDSLSASRPERSTNKGRSILVGVTIHELTCTSAVSPFATTQAAAVWTAISSIWSAQVYIPELSHRFWKLTLQVRRVRMWANKAHLCLQIISRYKAWLEGNMPALEPATPANQQTEAAPPESVAADEALLTQLATVLTDVKAMESQVWKLWREELSVMLPELTDADGAGETPISLEGTGVSPICIQF